MKIMIKRKVKMELLKNGVANGCFLWGQRVGYQNTYHDIEWIKTGSGFTGIVTVVIHQNSFHVIEWI